MEAAEEAMNERGDVEGVLPGAQTPAATHARGSSCVESEVQGQVCRQNDLSEGGHSVYALEDRE